MGKWGKNALKESKVARDGKTNEHLGEGKCEVTGRCMRDDKRLRNVADRQGR